MPWLLFLTRLSLGGVFLYLSLDKIQHPRVFAGAIMAYDVVPPILIPVSAVVFPWVEFFAGLCLLLGLLHRASALLIGLMSCLFFVMVASALARGLEIGCGCFSQPFLAKISGLHLFFDALLCLGAWLIWRRGPGPMSMDRLLFGAEE